MPKAKWIDKKSAQHFTLVHRPQNDPLIYDENAPSMVLNPTEGSKNAGKSKNLGDLASELGSDAQHIRANEGEAANYGVYYDDSEYDYMQHLRDLNTGGGNVVFVEAKATGNAGKGKQTQSLEDALKKMDLEHKAQEVIDPDMLPSKDLPRMTYDQQQDVPDAIAGFQPDMDPRLREVLEALEDDAYIDEEDAGIFEELANDGYEIDEHEFEDNQFDDEEGWESDDTAKPNKEYKDSEVPQLVAVQEEPEQGPSQDWLEDFKKFKKEQKSGGPPKAAGAPSQSELQSTWTTTTNGGRRKKRKGALTVASGFSMSSSSLVRTEQLSFLDARFDKIEEKYNEDFDDTGSVSAISTASSVTGPVRGDFDGIMDEFLGSYGGKPGKRTSKKSKAQTGDCVGECDAGCIVGQMFSPFDTSTQSSTPATSNPFAPKANPFSQDGSGASAFGAKPNAPNPFAQITTSSSNVNGAPNPFAPPPLATAADHGKQSSKPVWEKQTNGPQPSFGQFGGKSISSAIPDSRVSSTPASPFSSAQKGIGMLPSSNDPHAKKIYEQLRQDGIAPPAWPSQPGDPQNKAQMAKFREQYEDYRSKVRASLTRAGLIDDPTKRKKLSDAIDFKGICEDMCPEYEKITRITEHDIPTPEKDPQTTFASTTRMVKKLARSAAGQEAPLPMDVLSVPTLRKTLNYLVDDLLRNDENLPTVHGYLWDRTRAIRRDFSFFSALSTDELKVQASVLEDIARFHVTALHLLSEGGKAPEDFVEQQELEQLGKALLTLRDIYDDCNAQGSPCENEAEFRAYHLLFRANDPNILENVQPSLWEFDIIRTAASLVEALQDTTNFHGPLQDGPSLAAGGAHNVYFRIVKDRSVSYTMACFAECHFPQLRRSILQCLQKGLSRPREASRDVTAAALNKHLQFDTVQQAIDFAELHKIVFQPSQQNPADKSLSCAVLHNLSTLPHHRLKHQFSQSLVEDKRGSRTLPEVIHKTVFQDAATSGHKEASLAQEGSLFVQDESSKAPSSMPCPPPRNPFGGFGQSTANGATTIDASTKAPDAATQTTPSFVPQEAKPQVTARRSASNFHFKHAEKTTPAPGLGGTQLTNPFAKALPPVTEVVSSAAAAKENSTSKADDKQTVPVTTDDGSAKITFPSIGVQQATPELSSAASSTTPQKVFSDFAGFKPMSKEPAAMVSSTQPQSASSAFSGFSSQPQTGKPVEAAKSSTPPGSPVPATPSTQSAFTRPPKQPEATEPPSKPNSALRSFTPPSNPPVFLGSTNPPGIAPPVASPPVQPPPPPQPKRDRLLDFTRWFVEGDDGLLTDFQQHFLDGLLTPIFLDWQKKEAERRRREEELRNNAIADDFRQHSLSVKYFYRWKTQAREKRLKFLRRSGRDQLREFYRAQQKASRMPVATTKRKLEIAPVSQPNREQALMEGLRRSQTKKRDIPPPAPSSTVDVRKSRDSAAAIGRHFNLPMSQSGTSSPSRSRSSSVSKGGFKTRALREELLGTGAGRFRRSLPSITSSEESRPENTRSSKVSERWRLKAMGIVQLPDGTAVPESLMHDRRFNTYSRPSQRASSITSVPSRRPSVNGLSAPPPFSSTKSGASPPAVFEDTASNKRKRASEDSTGSVEPDDDGPVANGHKRVMSDAKDLVKELRMLREEMEEGMLWFRSQNERLHTEVSSRGGTPLSDYI
ncbi:hypothetical protein NHJ13734_007566 [Beauveria thailandica]